MFTRPQETFIAHLLALPEVWNTIPTPMTDSKFSYNNSMVLFTLDARFRQEFPDRQSPSTLVTQFWMEKVQ